MMPAHRDHYTVTEGRLAPFEDLEDRSGQNVGQLLDSLAPQVDPFRLLGVEIAPFVIVAAGRFVHRRIEQQRLSAPLLGNPKLLSRVAINKSWGGEVLSASSSSTQANALLGGHIRAIPLGETNEGNQIFLSPNGYFGESVPVSTPDEAPLRSFSGSTHDTDLISEWLKAEHGEEMVPVVSFHPERHLNNYPYRISNLLAYAAFPELAQ